MSITPDITNAIQEIRELFPGTTVDHEEDGQGGAYVTVSIIDIGIKYSPAVTWCGFHITFQYPRADVYPHFISSEIKRQDGSPHGGGISMQHWREKPAFQLSRRSNRLDPEIDTAATKLAKVIAWLRSL